MKSISTSNYMPRVGEQGKKVTRWTAERNYNVNRWTAEAAYFSKSHLKIHIPISKHPPPQTSLLVSFCTTTSLVRLWECLGKLKWGTESRRMWPIESLLFTSCVDKAVWKGRNLSSNWTKNNLLILFFHTSGMGFCSADIIVHAI